VAHCVGRGSDTVEAIADELALTPNAVRFHLAALEAQGLVRRTTGAPTGAVGKPRDVYELTDAAIEARSRAYAPALAAVIDELAARLDPTELAPLLVRAGASLAAGLRRPARKSERVRRAVATLERLGAEIEVERTGDSVVLRGHACPLASVVARHPAACLVVAGLVGALTEAPVLEECDHGARPRCRLRMARG
jgi:predicted ArsR family transcriptional regulator